MKKIEAVGDPWIHVILILSNPDASCENLEKLLSVAYNLASDKKTSRQGILNAAELIIGVASHLNLHVSLLEQSARAAQTIALHPKIDKKTLGDIRFAIKSRIQEIQQEIREIKMRRN
ncbi:hypothetical protein HYT26_00815 [Candidatus Pacearchaeota archaeon]|nr:hypothetical protein [Candidatus Pacearchaeota archaeon]